MMVRVATLMIAMLSYSGWALAESLVAARAIPARSVVSESDVAIASKTWPGALVSMADAVGKETRVTIYAGRPLRAGDLGPPALIERNDIVRLRYAVGALIIEADGRALGRGAAGDRISVMNLSSRATVSGAVTPEGIVEVMR